MSETVSIVMFPIGAMSISLPWVYLDCPLVDMGAFSAVSPGETIIGLGQPVIDAPTPLYAMSFGDGFRYGFLGIGQPTLVLPTPLYAELLGDGFVIGIGRPTLTIIGIVLEPSSFSLNAVAS
jgi:hypothetical protein